MAKKVMAKNVMTKGSAAIGILLALTTWSEIADCAPAALPPLDAGTLTSDERNNGVELPDFGSGTATIAVPEEEKPEMSMAAEVKVQVNGFRITGQDVYQEKVLQELLKDYQGRMVTFKELQQGADKLTAYFRQRGYLMARAYLPAQKITGGIVEYTILVGRLGKVNVDNKTKIHDYIVNRELGFMKPGDYLTRKKLERAVWLLSDLAGADAQAKLSPGERSGTVDVLIKLAPHQGKCGALTGDNYGNRYTNYNTYGLSYDILNPEHEGGQLALAGSATGEELYSYNINYTLPVLQNGWKASIGYNRLSYHLGDIYRPLAAYGTSRTLSAGLDYAVVRSQYRNLYAALHYEHTKLTDEIRLADSCLRKYSHGVVASLYGEQTLSKGVSSWRVDYKWGTLGFRDEEGWQQDKWAHTAGTFHKMRVNWQHYQHLPHRLNLLLSARGQLASHNLDSSEHFSLGGASGVRAYPASEASGDVGYLLRAELRYPLWQKDKNQMQLAGFIDHGGVNLECHKQGAGENHRYLQGAGIGILLTRSDEGFLRADYAWPLGAERSRNDRNNASGHFWLRGGIYF
ncbi:Hemolysin activation/secretion protein [Selenomonas sp. WCT3]|nr:Hemolysin activation/secretion protein [Selenomonas ruminantium]